jgi:hypothetical protein
MHAQVTPAEPRDGLRTDADFDAAWQEVLASLQTSTEAPLPSWPEEPVDTEEGVDPAEEDHFVPPPPPPLPRLRSVTAAALGAIALGLFILATGVDGGNLTVFAVIAILAGVASLVWNMRNGPPTDSGWDDGAVI